jgi:hypothetical protein
MTTRSKRSTAFDPGHLPTITSSHSDGGTGAVRLFLDSGEKVSEG